MQIRSDAFSDESVSRPWRARWIGPYENGEKETRALFRREFQLERCEGCRLFISAEREYTLYVNGRYVSRGVPPSTYYYKFYDELDLGNVLQVGRNCIAVHVSIVGAPQAGLLAELVDAEGRLLLITDKAWRVTSRTGWSVVDPMTGGANSAFQEYFDARLQPHGWEQPDFDDSLWARPHLYPELGRRGCPWIRMVPRRIPPLAEWDVRPHDIAYTEEGLDILSRSRAEALSVVLSAAGRPVKYARVDAPEALCRDDGETVLQCSTAHQRDRAFDGIYSPSVVLDFGKVITGYLTIELKGVAGGELDIGYVERLLDGHFNNALEVPYADRYFMTDGLQRFASTVWKSFRFVKLRLRGTEAPVAIRSVTTRICTYPYEESGAFESGDEMLNRVFEICRYTIRLSSRDYLVDTPWRERNQWLGDNAAVVVPGIYACFGDTALPRQFLEQAASSSMPTGLLANTSQAYNVVGRTTQGNQSSTIPDYSLWWIQALRDHLRFTGDERLVHALYPHVAMILQYHWRHMNEYGLVGNFPTWTFIDHVFKPAAATTAAYNALWFGTLADGLELARLVGDADTAAKTAASRDLLAANFAEAFFDSELGVFRDGFGDGGPVEGVSEHSNLAAICWGLADRDTAASIIAHLYEKKDVAYLEAAPFFCVVVLRALRGAGRADLALRLIRDRWGKRMVDVGMTSTTEEWNASGSWRGAGNSYVGIYRSLSHAWSACPAEFLIRQLAGFEILEPGCRKVRLDPVVTPFDYHVAIPTPHGAIQVSLSAGKVEVEAPDSVVLEMGRGPSSVPD